MWTPTKNRLAFLFSHQMGWAALCVEKNQITDLTFAWNRQDQAIEVVKKWEAELAEPDANATVWLERLKEFGENQDTFEDLPISFAETTPFQRKVLKACRKVKPGSTITYGELASKAGSPQASRAVGNIMARNRIPLLIPCHRVLRAGGQLGGFSARQGVSMKARLLEIEDGPILRPARYGSVHK